MRIAVVYDRVNKIGGAERILTAIHKIWPNATLFTAVYDKNNSRWADGWDIRTSFLQRIFIARNNHEFFAWLAPFAFEQFSFDEYDVVISITSAEAKSIITKPNTLHICYCLTPTRYLWSGYNDYISESGLGYWDMFAKFVLFFSSQKLRLWDKISAARPDYFFCISHIVKKRIIQYYNRDVLSIIYPPVSLKTFSLPQIKKKSSFFLVVSRLVSYKKIDIVIKACNRLQLPLLIIGTGRDKKRLQKIAGSTIRFIDYYLTDEELVRYYQQCKALLFAGVEDFGLVSVEAQACGTPVIAYKNSGIAESIIDGKTGILFEEQTVESLLDAINQFNCLDFDPEVCRKNAESFSDERFMKAFQINVMNVYKQYRTSKKYL